MAADIASSVETESKGWTINHLIKAGMEFFTGKTVLKATMESAVADMTAQRDAETARAEKLTAALSESQTARTTAESAMAPAKASLATATERVTALEAENATLKARSKSTAEAAAEIAASAGHAPVSLPPADPAAADQSPEALAAQLAKIPPTDGKARAEFLQKHRAKLYAFSKAQARE